MEYPKQEFSRRATIAKRDRVAIFLDAASGGSSNPDYSHELADSVAAEILQVTGGETVRGKQVEANTQFVVSINWIPDITLNAKCKIVILSGIYAGTSLFTHRVHYETNRTRPRDMQLHCRARE